MQIPWFKAILAVIIIVFVGWLTWLTNDVSSNTSLFNQGALAAVVLLLGILVLPLLRQWQWWWATFLLIIVTPLAISGFIFSGSFLGISDWDYYFSYHHDLRQMIVAQNTFPFWNPYICGGTAGLGDPEFPVFAPTFLFELALGVPAGLRAAIFFTTAVGALGMLWLGKRLGLSANAALLAALGYGFGSVSLLEIVEGHPNVFAAMYLPWIFWAWINAYTQKLETRNQKLVSPPISNFQFPISQLASLVQTFFNPWILLTGIFLALAFFQGGIYLLMYTALAFLFLIIALPGRLASLKVTITAGLWALGFTAIKLVPVGLWLAHYPDKAYASSALTLPWLHRILLGRFIHGSENIIPFQGGGWHEYGAYLGPVLLALAFAGILAWRRRPVVRLLWLGALLALLISSTGPWLKPLFDQAPFLPRSNISRIIILAVMPLCLLAGFGLDVLIRGRRYPLVSSLAKTAFVGLVALDLMSLAYVLSQQAFVLPGVFPSPDPAPAPIAYTVQTYTTRFQGVDYTRAYAAAEAGFGTLSYCSVLGPSPAVRAVEHDYNDYVSLSDPKGRVTLVNWSPNKVTVRAEATQTADVILNMNYAPGWQVNGGPAAEIDNRLGARVAPGSSTLTFSYHTPGFKFGAGITALSVLAAAIYLKRLRLNDKMIQPGA